MRRAVRKIGLTAPIFELVAKPIRGERFTVLRNQQRHVADSACFDARPQIGMQRDVDVDRIAMLVLRLPKSYAPVADVLPAETRRIFPATCRVPQNVESKTGLC